MSTLKARYTKQELNVKETITSNQLNNIIDLDASSNINSLLLSKIKSKLGNKCNENGFVDKESIQIISRSIGKINSSHFNGDIVYNIALEASICVPVEGSEIRCTVVGKNKIGVYAVCSPIHIILASVHHEDTSIFKDLNKDDVIRIEVINFSFKLNSDSIRVIGKFISKVK